MTQIKEGQKVKVIDDMHYEDERLYSEYKGCYGRVVSKNMWACEVIVPLSSDNPTKINLNEESLEAVQEESSKDSLRNLFSKYLPEKHQTSNLMKVLKKDKAKRLVEDDRVVSANLKMQCREISRGTVYQGGVRFQKKDLFELFSMEHDSTPFDLIDDEREYNVN